MPQLDKQPSATRQEGNKCMKIEIVAIGNEVLSGFTVNSNAAFMSEELLKEGWRVSRHTVLPDDLKELHDGLSEALARNQLVITTGGLGPTCDDLTRGVAAKLFHSDFRFDEGVAAELRKRYGANFSTLQDQATVPSKAQVLKNSVGTAPGLIFQNEQSTLILLPGVPPEMKAMWSDQVVPYLRKRFANYPKYHYKNLNFFDLPEPTVDAVLRQLQPKYPDVEFGIYPGQMLLEVRMLTLSDNASKAMSVLDKPYHELLDQFSIHAFESSSGKIEETVHSMFLKSKLTLAAAESCTGGSLAARLTKIPGASQYFLGSVVAYSNELKINLLGVPEIVLKDKGAVSEEVVLSMLQGLFSKLSCDYAVAVSGIAGPSGGTPEKPVGTVCCAVGRRNKQPKTWTFHARGNREMIIERSTNILQAGLIRYMREQG